MRSIEFFSFSNMPSEIKNEWKSRVSEVIDVGIFVHGTNVRKFEEEFANYLGVKNVIGVGNGYDGLVLALQAYGLGIGDKVAVPNHTFIATWLAVWAVGATPVGIDIDEYGLMNLDELERKQVDLGAVIPVHMHGQMVDMERLSKWCSDKDIVLIEDCAQIHGGSLNFRKAGAWSDCGVFSFYPTKNLGALGDGGCVATNDESIAAKIRALSNYGRNPLDGLNYTCFGRNSRLDEIQATVMRLSLTRLDEWNSMRQRVGGEYMRELSLRKITFLRQKEDSVFHHFVVLSQNRNKTRALLAKHGIVTSIHYEESASKIYGRLKGIDDTQDKTKADILATRTLSLPLSPWISESEIERVLEVISIPEVEDSFF
jgi:dTDP-4-amino-4,6-dideoxygalactose transaminase